MRIVICFVIALFAIESIYALDTHSCSSTKRYTFTKFYPYCSFSNDIVRQITRDPAKNIVFKCRNVPANTALTLSYTLQYDNANTNLPFSISSWMNTNSSLNSGVEPADQVDAEILSIFTGWVNTPQSSRASYSPACLNGVGCNIYDTTSPRSHSASITTPNYFTTITTFIHDESTASLPNINDLNYQSYCQSFLLSSLTVV